MYLLVTTVHSTLVSQIMAELQQLTKVRSVHQGATSLQQTSQSAGAASVMVATRAQAQAQHYAIPNYKPKESLPKLLRFQVKEKSKCIQRGQRSIRKLNLKLVVDDKAKGVAKYQFGKPRPGSPEYVVMLVGATGAGKTTLINGMANYILGVEWEDEFQLKLITEERGANQAHNQTSCITAYTIHKQEDSAFPHTLTIVDTPGFRDTKGLESDKRIVAQMKELFSMSGEEGIDHIHGIGFVSQASLARLTHTQRYVFDSILAMFGKDIGSNILLMATFADGNIPPVLEAVKAAGIEYHKQFKFNNSAIFTEDTGADDESEDHSFTKMFWDMGMASFRAFFEQLALMEVRSLQLTKEVLEEREQLEAIMQSLQPQIQAILGKIDTLIQEEKIMDQHKADMKASNFTYVVMEHRISKHDIQGEGWYATNCISCNFTCHKPSSIPNNEDLHRCPAMSGGYCTVCPGKCHWTKHCNNEFWFELQEVRVEKTYDALKKRYEDAMYGKSSKEDVVGVIRSELAARYLMIRKAQQILARLDEIALRPNPLNEVEYIDLLILSEKQQGKEGFLGRVECLQNVRQEAKFLSTVRDDKIFENEALKLAQKLAKAEADK